MGNKKLCAYDSLGWDNTMFMKFICRYLSDEYTKRTCKRPRGAPVPPEFVMEAWELNHFYTRENKIQSNSVDCGVYVLKFLELLPGDLSILSEDCVLNYRTDLIQQIESSS